MKKRTAVTVLFLVVLAMAHGAAGAPNDSGLKGTWRITVQPDPQSGMPPTLNYASFTKDGRLVNIDPAAGTAVGEWEKTAGHDYGVTFTGFASLNGQTVQYKVRAVLTVAEDQFSGTFRSTVTDVNGIVLFSFEGTVIGARTGVEPL
jgi:hypothetical protein